MSTLYIRYPSTPGGAATSVSAAAFPLLAPNGSAAAPSYSFGGGTGGAVTGLYAAGVNILGFATAGLTAGNIDASQNWNFVGSLLPTVDISPNLGSASFRFATLFVANISSGGANTLNFLTNSTNAGSISSNQTWTIGPSAGANTHIINASKVRCQTAADGTEFQITGNASNAGALFLSGASADSTGGVIGLYGNSHATNANQTIFQNAGTASGSISSANLWTIGTGTSTQHALNTLLATNGAQTATMTNLPAAATSGNPNGWLKITINGATAYIPFWH